MRTLVDIPTKDLETLNKLSKQKKVSRAHLVRCAIREYLGSQEKDTLMTSFGVLAGHGIDGLEFQERMRREWDREL